MGKRTASRLYLSIAVAMIGIITAYYFGIIADQSDIVVYNESFWLSSSSMLVKIVLFAILTVTFVGILAFYLGVFDRPEFVFHKSLWLPDGKSEERPLYVILAMTRTKDIGRTVGRLLTDTRSPLVAEEASRNASAKAAQEYGAPEGSDAISVGLYFEDPNAVKEPRWGIGWALAVPTYADLESWRAKVESSYSGPESIRAVRIGPSPVLKARIPWRTVLTPMIAPILHWRRGFQTFEDGQAKGSYHADNGRPASDPNEIACEIYVMGKNCSREYIDYVVLMGDTKTVWEDSFPTPAEAGKATSSMEK